MIFGVLKTWEFALSAKNNSSARLLPLGREKQHFVDKCWEIIENV